MAAKPRKNARDVSRFYETVLTHLEEEETMAANKKASSSKKRAPSAYNRFVGAYMRKHKGSTMSQAAAAWKHRGGSEGRGRSGTPRNARAPRVRGGTPRARKRATPRVANDNARPRRKRVTAKRAAPRRTTHRHAHMVSGHAGKRSCIHCHGPHTTSQHWSHEEGGHSYSRHTQNSYRATRYNDRPKKPTSMKKKITSARCKEICRKYTSKRK